MFIPNEKQCFWCGGRMKEFGVSSLGSGINFINYRCEDCKAIAHYAVCNEKPIKSFDIVYHMEEDEKK